MHARSKAVENIEFPPMIEVRKNLHVAWYRCPIERTKLRELMTPSDIKGYFQAVGHLFIWICTGFITYYLFNQELWWGFAAALFLHGTVGSFFIAAHHELCHNTVFKTKRLNTLFLYIFSFLGFMNFRIYQFSHNYHHRYTLFLEGDREEVLPASPSLRFLYIFQLFTVNITGGYQSRGLVPTLKWFCKIAFNQFDNPYTHWGEELYEGHVEQRKKAVVWARTLLLLHLVLIIFFIVIGQPIVAVLVSGSTFIGNWRRYFVGVPMHCGLKSNIPDFRKCVRTITLDPISEFLYWHMNWHLEHHMFAGVPCYNLAKLHQIVAYDMPKPRTLIEAWQEMRLVWIRQQREPNYSFDTPIPDATSRIPDGKEDGLAASIGDLGPRELYE